MSSLTYKFRRRENWVVTLVEEHTEQHWELAFAQYQAVKVTTEECVWKTELGQMFAESPRKGGFFEVEDSDWIRTLGKGEIRFLEKSRHFIVSTYDDVIEIVAWDCSVKKLEGRGYPYSEELQKRMSARKVRPDTVPRAS